MKTGTYIILLYLAFFSDILSLPGESFPFSHRIIDRRLDEGQALGKPALRIPNSVLTQA